MIGVIADDISGAAEIAGVALRLGLRAEVLVKGRPSGKVDLVCIDTDSRGGSAREAARRAAAAARLLHRVGAKWIYKKVDSVLRGQVAAEIQAIRKELKLKTILLHPANPSLGRTIKNGKYFIHGQSLHKTEFARDPAHPRKTANVGQLLGSTLKFPVQVCKLTEPLADSGVIICESSSPRDVPAWVQRARPEMLLAGGAEFFAALLVLRVPASLPAIFQKQTRNSPARVPPLPGGRELFVCGTTSQSSQKFIRAARLAGTPVFSLPAELAGGAKFTRAALKQISDQVLKAFQKHPRVILQAGLPPVQDSRVAQKLSVHLTRLAETILNQSNIKRVYAEGGATAVELVGRMGWNRLTVLREVSPGVAALTVSGKRALQLTIKPGTYVWPDEILNAQPIKIL